MSSKSFESYKERSQFAICMYDPITQLTIKPPSVERRECVCCLLLRAALAVDAALPAGAVDRKVHYGRSALRLLKDAVLDAHPPVVPELAGRGPEGG